MHIHTFLSLVATLLLLATQISCAGLPGFRPAPTPVPLTLPHELLQAEADGLNVTLTLIEGDSGRKDIAWTVDSTGEGPGYEVALHQATLPADSKARSWAEADKASSNKSTSRWRSPRREPGRQSAGKTMLQEARPGERVAVFLELKVELAGENGARSEIGTIRGPVLLERVAEGWTLVSPAAAATSPGPPAAIAVPAAAWATAGLARRP